VNGDDASTIVSRMAHLRHNQSNERSTKPQVMLSSALASTKVNGRIHQKIPNKAHDSEQMRASSLRPRPNQLKPIGHELGKAKNKNLDKISEIESEREKWRIKLLNFEGKDVLVHSKIQNMYGFEAAKNVARNQSIVFNSDQHLRELSNEKAIVEFLKQSKKYSHVEEVQFLAEGGESTVYKLKYMGFDDLVLKVPKAQQTKRRYLDLMLETQLLKCIYHPDYIVEVKEELIEVSTVSSQLQRYCAILEKA